MDHTSLTNHIDRLSEYCDSCCILCVGDKEGSDMQVSFHFSTSDLAPVLGMIEDILTTGLRLPTRGDLPIEDAVDKVMADLSRKWNAVCVLCTWTEEEKPDTFYTIRISGNYFAIKSGLRAVMGKMMGQGTDESWKNA